MIKMIDIVNITKIAKMLFNELPDFTGEYDAQYCIHNNGGVSFVVRLFSDIAGVYTIPEFTGEFTAGYINVPHKYTVLVYKFTFTKCWVPKGYYPVNTVLERDTFYDGNTLLFNTGNEYIQITHRIIKFKLEDQVVKYYSWIDVNDIPHPVIMGYKYIYDLSNFKYIELDILEMKKRDYKEFFIYVHPYEKYLANAHSLSRKYIGKNDYLTHETINYKFDYEYAIYNSCVVRLMDNTASIYRTYDGKHTEDLRKYNKFECKFKFIKCWIPKGYLLTSDGIQYNKSHDGNTLLLNIGNNDYIFICDNIYKFTLQDQIIKYYSVLNNDNIPHPIIVGDKHIYNLRNFVYTNKENLNVDVKKYKELPFTAESANTEFMEYEITEHLDT